MIYEFFDEILKLSGLDSYPSFLLTSSSNIKKKFV